MSCSSNKKDDRFDFFNNIDTYIKEAKKIKNPNPEITSHGDCKIFSGQIDLGNIEKAESLCNSFARLNKFLVTIKKEDDNHCKFLNYWLNSELSQKCSSENCGVRYIYNGMDSYLFRNEVYSSLNCELCNINKVELHKMSILYNLHDKRNEIHDIINSQKNLEASKLHESSTECFTNYKKGLAMCNNKDENFCKLLENFKTEYRKLYSMVETKGHDYSKYFQRLPGDENSNIISTAVTGTVVGLIPFFGVLYKVSELNIKL
ncbi:hypothetical protein PVBG_04017 [Plasmodium vivax Brazil I]|uniref:PIR Superfamily Protein n=1 Tax=Plasmodium vivax (strain Brazil I) TaxID=1033975 RepID=A0A0J9SY74_PLAV1|nr:hypothetical protein PVBG_04017 [Plasmodium vivax Brazil I]